MYQTNHTNRADSSVIANSFQSIQQDFWGDDRTGHNADNLMIDQVFSHYHQQMKSNSDLVNLFKQRKIDPKYIDQFKIGFSDRTLGYELSSHRCLLGSQNRGQLQRLGLLKSSGHEFFQGSIVFPYLDDDGQIAGAYGRRVQHQSRNPKYHHYWNTQKVSFFNCDIAQLPSELILTKSAIDTMTLLTAGVSNTVGTMGIEGFNDIQLQRLVNDEIKRMYIVFDNTPSANHCALLVAQALHACGIECYRVELPVGHDINRLAMSCSNFEEEFKTRVEQAKPLKVNGNSITAHTRTRWSIRIDSIEEGIHFYLDEQKNQGKSARTLNSARIHLDRFAGFCCELAVDDIDEITDELLDGYQLCLESEKNVFTGRLISDVTKSERKDAVTRMLSRLHYYGVIIELPAFSNQQGALH